MKSIQIDGEKFRALLDKAHLKYSVVSKEIGYKDKYISNCIGYNYIGAAAAQLLEIRHGIMLRDYVYVEPPKPIEPPKPEQTEIPVEAEVSEVKPIYTPVAALDMGEHQQAIALAMQNTRAPQIDYDKLRDAIREGILDAIYNALNDTDTRNAISGLLMHAHLSALELNFKRAISKTKGA